MNFFVVCTSCAFLFFKSSDLLLYFFFPPIMNICIVIASLGDDGFREPISGGERLDSSHFLGFGPSMAQMYMGC